MRTSTKIIFSTLGILGLGAMVWVFRRGNNTAKRAANAAAGNAISSAICAEAKKYIGIIEKKPNAGWENADDFTKKMSAIGWQKGMAYCAAFVKMVFQQICTGGAKDFFAKNISLNTGISWTNLSKPSEYCSVIPKPEAGCIVCYNGHMEICLNVRGDGYIECASANSMSKDAQGNEIEGVFLKVRKAGSAIGSEQFLGYVRILKLN